MSNIIKRYYLGDRKFSTDEDTMKAMIKMFGDAVFTIGYEKAANLYAQVAKSPVQFYKFSYRPNRSNLKVYKNRTIYYGEHL